MSDPIEPEGPLGPTGIVAELTIYINGRSLPWSEPTISFDQVVEEWNRLDPTRHVQGTLPGITWKVDDSGTTGILYPDESTQVVDGLAFTIDDTYLA